MLRSVEGRRLNSEGRCCPLVEIALASFCSGRKSLLFAIRGRLDDRGIEAGDGDFGGGVVAPRRSAMTDMVRLLNRRSVDVIKVRDESLVGQLSKLGSSSPLSLVLTTWL